VAWDAFWADFGAFMATGWGVPVKVAIIILAAIVLRLILQVLIRRTVERVVSGVKAKYAVDETRELTAQSPVTVVRRVQRTRSLGRVYGNAVTSAIAVIAVFLVFATVFPAATSAFAIITAAIGAGLGIGAQGIVKDILNGISMVGEDQLGIGDVVDVGHATGVVEDVGIRITQIRDVNGTLWFVRNGEINRVGNMSHGWARAIIDLAVPISSNADAVQATIRDAVKAFAKDPEWRTRVLERPEVWGIESISTDAIVVRVVAKTRTSAREDVARALRARIKAALDAQGVWLPPVASVPLDGPAAEGGKPAP